MAQANDVRQDFLRQSLACEFLGSPFTSRLCRVLSECLSTDTEFERKVLEWQGNLLDDVLPLRVAGGLHALKRSGHAPELASLYEAPPEDDALFALTLKTTIREHESFLLPFLGSAPQTNEVSRSGALLGGVLIVAQETRLPLSVYEIGSSAGLNLSFDAYSYDLGGKVWPGKDSGVNIICDWQGAAPSLDISLAVIGRMGCDINPLNASDRQQRERMLCYIWPDQKERLARIEAALAYTAKNGITPEKADAASWVEKHFQHGEPQGHVRMLMHSIVWQYLPDETRASITQTMNEAGEKATANSPIAWLRMEADQKDIASAGLRLSIWPDGTDREIGRVDFHGRWVRWS